MQNAKVRQSIAITNATMALFTKTQTHSWPQKVTTASYHLWRFEQNDVPCRLDLCVSRPSIHHGHWDDKVIVTRVHLPPSVSDNDIAATLDFPNANDAHVVRPRISCSLVDWQPFTCNIDRFAAWSE